MIGLCIWFVMLEIHINETNIIAGMLPSAHTVLCGVVALIGQQFYATLLSIENKKQIICFGNWLWFDFKIFFGVYSTTLMAMLDIYLPLSGAR